MYNLLLNELKKSKRKALKETYEKNLKLIESISYPSIEALILHNSHFLKTYPEYNLMYIKKFVKEYTYSDKPIIYKDDENIEYSEEQLDILFSNIKPENISFEIDSDEYGNTIKFKNTDISIFIPEADD